MQLDRLKWQTTREIDYGFDLRLWNRLSLTFDYYDKKTSDLLLKETALPATTGYDKIAWINSGILSNKGVEFRFDWQALRYKDWNLSFNANISRNINKVEELPSTYVQENYSFGNGEYALRIVEGSPVGAFYGYRYQGVYQNTAETYARDREGNVMYNYKGQPIIMHNGNQTVYPGDARYEDINHDGVIDENDIVYLGNANPKFTAGGGFKLKWKDFLLTTFFYGRSVRRSSTRPVWTSRACIITKTSRPQCSSVGVPKVTTPISPAHSGVWVTTTSVRTALSRMPRLYVSRHFRSTITYQKIPSEARYRSLKSQLLRDRL